MRVLILQVLEGVSLEKGLGSHRGLVLSLLRQMDRWLVHICKRGKVKQGDWVATGARRLTTRAVTLGRRII
jgi:hypothetical protein